MKTINLKINTGQNKYSILIGQNLISKIDTSKLSQKSLNTSILRKVIKKKR